MLWTWALHGIPTLSSCKSLKTKLFSEILQESFHQIDEIMNNSFIDKMWLVTHSTAKRSMTVQFFSQTLQTFFIPLWNILASLWHTWMNELCSPLPPPRSFLSYFVDEGMRNPRVCFASLTAGTLYHQEIHQDLAMILGTDQSTVL